MKFALPGQIPKPIVYFHQSHLFAGTVLCLLDIVRLFGISNTIYYDCNIKFCTREIDGHVDVLVELFFLSSGEVFLPNEICLTSQMSPSRDWTSGDSLL
jgi:hypothetical protein